jgi:protein phosphatase
MLYCPNYTCQAPNAEANKFCQKCRTPLPKIYLWAIGSEGETYQPGDLLNSRYLCKAPRIFLDTKPGLLPTEMSSLPTRFIPYLKLVSERLHIPQIYAVVQRNSFNSQDAILLLNHAAILIPTAPAAIELLEAERSDADTITVQLLPRLDEVWSQATALRQLNWLWQMAQLWQALSLEVVASSLTNPNLIRVEGPVIRLLELQFDRPDHPPTLADLGQLWSKWSQGAQPAIATALSQISEQLEQGYIRSAEQLVDQLNPLLEIVGRSQTRQIQIATRTDRGPSRQRNEDACYPADGTVTPSIVVTPSSSAAALPLVIVCDGIGGHQGGDVASHLAIEAVKQQVERLNLEQLTPTALTVELEKASCVANDVISQRNDSENRFERQRMGTTLVVGLVRGYELYVTHVGDSRAYWITRWGCYQVTLDDDVAAREVRLGYSTYREALQQPSSGSLVQALGMGTSNALHPTVQRFILDEDSVFLLCSDGLSDNNRVEEIWETIILPLLEGKSKLTDVTQQLVEIANTLNGHDNVTVGVMYLQVTDVDSQAAPIELDAITDHHNNPAAAVSPLKSQLADEGAVAEPQAGVRNDLQPDPQPTLRVAPASRSTFKTKVLPTVDRRPNSLVLLAGIFALLALGGWLSYLLVPLLRAGMEPLTSAKPSPPTNPASPAIRVIPAPITALEPQIFIQVNLTPAPSASRYLPLTLVQQPPQRLRSAPVVSETTPAAAENVMPMTPDPVRTNPSLVGAVPPGSVLYVMKKQGEGETLWVQVQVCHIPSETEAKATELANQGDTGWVEEANLLPLAIAVNQLTSEIQQICHNPAPVSFVAPDS